MTSPLAVPDFGVVHDAPWLSVCFHEAGHAVIAQAGGIEVDRVRAYTDGHGSCSYLPGERDTPELVRWSQVKSAAGGAAEQLALLAYAHQGAREADRRWTSNVCVDQANVAVLDDQPGAIGWDAAYTEALALLEPRWSDIEHVAYELSLTGRLSGAQVS